MTYQQLSPSQTYPETPVNENMEALGQAFLWAHDKTADAGLIVGFSGGAFNGDAITDATITCEDDAENFIVADRSTGALSVEVSTSSSDMLWDDTATYGRVARLTFAATMIVAFHDERLSVGGIFDHAVAAPVLDDAMVFKGVINCSTNPDYPAADAGAVYKVSVAGKIGGASGPNVEAGDTLYCITDATASGTQAGVGANWVIAQVNVDGAYFAGGTDVPVADGGTGVSALTAYAPIFGGTTTTGAVQSGTVGTTGQVLTSNGAAALPTMQSQPYDVAAFYPGIPTASAKMVRVPMARAVTFAANFASSQFKASANATASTVFDIQKNGSSIGTCTIGAGSTTPTFATTGGAVQSFAAGDVLSIICAGTPDATLADPGFMLVGTR